MAHCRARRARHLHATEWRTGHLSIAGRGGRLHHLRPARRRDHAAVRRAARVPVPPPRARAPRAVRRRTWPTATHVPPAARAQPGAPRMVGVCFGTSGPGATNLVTGICNANMDSVPDGRHHRQRADQHDRHRRLPGSRHHRHHHPDHQAELLRAQRARTSRASSTRRSTLPAPVGPGRSTSTSPRMCC